MVSCGLLILGPLVIHVLTQACRGEELPREAVLSWLTERILEGLGLEEAPRSTMQGPGGVTVQPQARHAAWRGPWRGKTGRVKHGTNLDQEMSLIILFPSSEPACGGSHPALGRTTNSHFSYSFQPSVSKRDTQVTSAHFWFYAGEGAPAISSSAQLFILTSGQQPFQLAEAPTTMSSDGWTTYHMDPRLLPSVGEGPFVLQIHCPACECHTNEPDKTPFLHLNAQPRVPVRSPRQPPPVPIPWSPSASYLLQRPSQERAQHGDCHREEVKIRFEELGWDSWIVHPKALTFYYCHGNCSAWDRTTAAPGVTQCCAPVPGSMKSLRVITTFDGGYSFKRETLPNIISEECACI